MGMLKRWLRFNTVGVAGVACQLGALWLCARLLGMDYVVATMIAVETAVLHNFAWHETWTWRGLPASGRWRRLLRFHLANGLVSISFNTFFTFLLKESAGLPLLVSNLIAIAMTGLLNFALANAFVFRRQPDAHP
jgi:putative flippase GtrA